MKGRGLNLRGMTRRSLLITAIAILVLVFGIASLSVLAAPPISESFRNDTATGWVLMGSAYLTSGVPPDPAGDGWLRLTSAGGSQAGSAIYDTAFSSTEGVQVAFTYATYGGNGADGITFYLIDGATGTPTVGAPGGSLGYSWAHDPGNPQNPGVTNGYVGIGLDEYGNFSHPYFGGCAAGCPGRISNSVTIRGSGSQNSGFNFLTRADYAIETGSRAGANHVRITIPPGTTLRITVEIDSGSGFVKVIDGYNLTTAPGQATLPSTFKMGFSASTGGSTNYHEIRGLVVAGANSTDTTVSSAPDPSSVGQSACFTATVTPSSATGTVTFLEGTTVLGTDTLSGGTAQFCTAGLSVGTHTITARYEGDSTYGGSIGTDTHVVDATAPEIDVQRPAGTSIPDGGTDDLGDQGTGTVHVSYTVDNTAGTAPLNITDVTASNLVNCSNFSLDTAMPMTVGAGATATFDISFHADTNNAFGFDMDIANNDADEKPYDIHVYGESRGDINGDGRADPVDVRLCLQIACGCGLINATAEQRAAADVDGDGDVDQDDATWIAEHWCGCAGN